VLHSFIAEVSANESKIRQGIWDKIANAMYRELMDCSERGRGREDGYNNAYDLAVFLNTGFVHSLVT
jgi:hypothetical protein